MCVWLHDWIYQQTNLFLLLTDVDTRRRRLHTALYQGGIKGKLNRGPSSSVVMYISRVFSVVLIRFICTGPQTLNKIPTSYLQLSVCDITFWVCDMLQQSVLRHMPLDYNKYDICSKFNPCAIYFVNISSAVQCVLIFFSMTLIFPWCLSNLSMFQCLLADVFVF